MVRFLVDEMRYHRRIHYVQDQLSDPPQSSKYAGLFHGLGTGEARLSRNGFEDMGMSSMRGNPYDDAFDIEAHRKQTGPLTARYKGYAHVYLDLDTEGTIRNIVVLRRNSGLFEPGSQDENDDAYESHDEH